MPDGSLYLNSGRSRRARRSDLDLWLSSALSGAAPSVAPVSDEGWTPKLVGEALIEAIRWVRRCGGRVGPGGFATARLPEAILSLDDHLAAGWGLPETADEPEEARLVIRPTPAQIDRHLAALQWPATYLCPANHGSARMVGLWATCKATRQPFARAIDGRGVSRPAAYALRDRGLSLIAQGLDRDGVPLSC